MTIMTALLIYDIHCPKTYRLIYKKLDKFVNSRIQKSVFEVVGTATELQQMFDEIRGIIDQETDSLAMIPLCVEDQKKIIDMGKSQKRSRPVGDYLIL